MRVFRCARRGIRRLRQLRSDYESIRKRTYNYFVDRQRRKVRRRHLDRCWCGGELLPFEWHKNYGVCATCGSYVDRRPPIQEELKRVYSFDLYWHGLQSRKGHPTIEQRTVNDLSDGRVDYWLGLVERYGPRRGTVVEVGCAHGVMLAAMRERGYECIGVEPDERTAAWTRSNTNLDIRAGFFPDVPLPECDLLLAFDVLEHSPDPLAFMRGAAAVLRAGGIAIIQSPVDRYDSEPPFGGRFESAFDDLEHLYLFTDKAMRELASRGGLEVVNVTERLWLHHEICVFRKPR